jgi:hypothetical protein
VLPSGSFFFQESWGFQKSATCPSTVPPTSCPRVPRLLSSAPTIAPMPRSPALLNSLAAVPSPHSPTAQRFSPEDTTPALSHLSSATRLFPRSGSKSFIYRFYAESPANSFIYRIYANRPGWGTSFLPNLTPSVWRLMSQLSCSQQLAASCFLLSLFFRLPSFVFNGLPPLFAKHRGWGMVTPNSLFAQRTDRLDTRRPIGRQDVR